MFMNQVQNKDNEFNDNMNESAFETIKNQLYSILLKLRYVILMLPVHRQSGVQKLKQWDLWGPLIICLIFSLPLAVTTKSHTAYDDFINVFLIFWIGSLLVGINCRLLGNKGSLFQSMSIMGYCMFPLAIFGFIVSVLPAGTPIWIKIIIIIIALGWSTISCLLVMRDIISQQKKVLCAYPIFLFYIFLSWYAIIT